MIRHAMAVFALLALLASPVVGQLPTKPTLTLEAAKEVASSAEAEARANGWNVVIAIVDDGAHLIYLQRMDGTQIGSVEVAIEKAMSAVLYRRSTEAFRDAVGEGNLTVLGLPGAMPVEGGLPLSVNDQTIGGIGVSGVPPEYDGAIARSGLRAFETMH